MNIAYNQTEDALLVVFGDTGKHYTINSSHKNWDTILNKLDSEDYLGLEDLFVENKKLQEYVMKSDCSEVEVDDYGVRYNGEYVANYLTQKIKNFSERSLPIKPLVNFFAKVMNNPSNRSVEYLYKFLEHMKMPILANGNFLAYKSVTMDYKDWRTQKVDNSIGQQVPRMNRNAVDDDPNNGCSRGYHAGSLEYASTFHATESRIIIVEIDPADCVMVPYENQFQKLRCTTYKVVGEYEKPLDDDYDDRYEDDFIEEDDDDFSFDAEEEIKKILSKIVKNEYNSSEELERLTAQLIELEEQR